VVFSDFVQQSVDIVVREILPAPLLVIKRFASDQREKASASTGPKLSVKARTACRDLSGVCHRVENP